MTNIELRKKYGDAIKTNYYIYPPHFFSPWDDFTLHITNWRCFLSRFDDKTNLKFLELGTAQGRATVWLLENILTTNNSKITTVDIKNLTTIPERLMCKYDGQKLIVDCIQNLQPYIDQNRCNFVKSTTDEFFKHNTDLFDFVYIDASHDPDQVLRDAIHSFDIIKPNGLLLFDDYGWGECGLGIECFLQCFKHKIKLLYKDYQVLIEKL